MNLSDLTEDERIALVALVLQLIRADGITTEDELEELRALGVEMGPKHFDAAYTRARDQFETHEEALEFARRAVERPEAQELVYTVLFDMAATDGIAKLERPLLDDVRSMWQIVTIER
jgi:uncharacterized tellurite resistance protein B-like protein